MKLNKSKIRQGSTFVRVPDLIYNEIDDEVAILSIDNGEYYTLNKTGAEIWSILKDKQVFSQIVNHLLSKYDIDKSVCVSDTQDYLIDMVNNGIIHFTDE